MIRSLTLTKATHLVRGFRDILVSGGVNPPDPVTDAARRRSWELPPASPRAERPLSSSVEWNAEGTLIMPERRGPPREQLRGLAELLDCAGGNIYFVLRAKDGTASPGEQVLRRFCHRVGGGLSTSWLTWGCRP